MFGSVSLGRIARCPSHSVFNWGMSSRIYTYLCEKRKTYATSKLYGLLTSNVEDEGDCLISLRV